MHINYNTLTFIKLIFIVSTFQCVQYIVTQILFSFDEAAKVPKMDLKRFDAYMTLLSFCPTRYIAI